MSDQRDEAEHINDELAAEETAPELSADERILLARFEGEVQEHASTPVQINVSWQVAWGLLATIQLACRNPQFQGAVRNIADGFGRHLEQQIVLGPASAEIAARGWDPGFDLMPVPPNESDIAVTDLRG